MAARKRTPLTLRYSQNIGYTDDLFSCWPWLGYVGLNGYGTIGSGGREGRPLLVHRLAWEYAYGPIPPGMHVCHHCDTPVCVRASHLFLGTQADNMADMMSKGRNGWMSRLTPQQVETILASTERQAALARRFGVHRVTVGDIVRRTTWTHL